MHAHTHTHPHTLTYCLSGCDTVTHARARTHTHTHTLTYCLRLWHIHTYLAASAAVCPSPNSIFI